MLEHSEPNEREVVSCSRPATANTIKQKKTTMVGLGPNSFCLCLPVRAPGARTTCSGAEGFGHASSHVGIRPRLATSQGWHRQHQNCHNLSKSFLCTLVMQEDDGTMLVSHRLSAAHLPSPEQLEMGQLQSSPCSTSSKL